MSIRINYNPMSVLTHRNLANSDRTMAGVLDRLSSGERLRRSADDPASMVLANAVRYHRSGVDRAQSNAEEAVTMLQTAEGGMDQITQVLQRMRTLTIAAASTATMDPQQLQALQSDLDNAAGSITTIASGTTFGAIPLLNGALRDTTLSDEAKEVYESLTFDWTRLPGGVTSGAPITIDPASATLTRPSITDSYGPGTPATSTAVTAGGVVSITGPKGSAALNLAPGTTIAGLVSAINAGASSTGVIAGYDEITGDITIESTAYGNSILTVDLTQTDGTDGAVSSVSSPTLVVNYIDRQGNPQSIILTQDPNSPDGRTFTNTTGDQSGFDGVSTVYDQQYGAGAISLVVKDTGTGGIGSSIAPATLSLGGTTTSTTSVQTGSLSSQRVNLEIPDMRAGALGTSAGIQVVLSATPPDPSRIYASVQDLVTNQALVNGDATTALAVIDAALQEVARSRGAVGTLQANTVERVMDSLRVSSFNLREFESTLRDVDMAAESAEYARVQVMLQAATAMLAQANQVPQTVLQLLK